jgi:hypothetical protein
MRRMSAVVSLRMLSSEPLCLLVLAERTDRKSCSGIGGGTCGVRVCLAVEDLRDLLHGLTLFREFEKAAAGN